MKIYEMKDYNEVSHKAASIIAAQVITKPNSVLGLATGSTPLGAYAKLVEWCKNENLDFSQITSVNLDEYKGLPRDNDQSYYYFMYSNLFNHVNIDLNNTHLPNGLTADATTECADYEALIAELGGIDLQLLGLGHNGHIGFNEPSDCFEKNTHCVNLQPSTIEANKRFFDSIEDVPKQAYTMGCGTIMRSRRILLVVNGAEKSEILKEALTGPITPKVPASILQLHPDVTVVADSAALSKMR